MRAWPCSLRRALSQDTFDVALAQFGLQRLVELTTFFPRVGGQEYDSLHAHGVPMLCGLI